jgi:malate synthase
MLERRFGRELDRALARRRERLTRIAAGERLGFREETRFIRERDWRVAVAPPDLSSRVVEITGPTDRRTVVTAMGSGADVFVADFEDATAPTWDNVIDGQRNLRDAVRRVLTFDDPTTGETHCLGRRPATLVVRPRGLHLPERHLDIDGRPAHGALVDFGLHFYHNAAELIARGSGPYYDLPKLESHREARLWNDIFNAAQAKLGIPNGTIRATVLIETLPAAFEMDEILYELREHASGLGCGRLDYVFSHIKTRRHDARAIFPDRARVTMTQPFLRAYAQLAIRTCHERGAYAIGGLSPVIPSGDASADANAIEQVRADKEREAADGHDGTRVAHPALVPVAREAFAARMSGPHQLHRLRKDVSPTADDLLRLPEGMPTERGLRLNVRVAIRYLESWLRGVGSVPLYGRMETAAAAEISRSQVWQWLHRRVRLAEGHWVTPSYLRRVVDEEMHTIRGEVGADAFASGRFAEARALFVQFAWAPKLDEFFTLRAYELLDTQ